MYLDMDRDDGNHTGDKKLGICDYCFFLVVPCRLVLRLQII